MNKIEIQERFSRASQTYSSVSGVQREMADKLFSIVSPAIKEKSRVLEFGVGTGSLSQQLCNHASVAELTMIDISSAMIEECKKGTENTPAKKKYIESDIEKFPLKGKFDVVVSNATVQWLKDFEALIEKLSQTLKSGSLFAFSSFGSHSLHELYTSYDATQESSLKRPVHFYSLDFIESALISNSFRLVKSGQELLKSYYPTVKDVLISLKHMGVTPKAHSGSRLTKSSIQLLEKYYTEQYAVAEGIPCTWENIWIMAEKV